MPHYPITAFSGEPMPKRSTAAIARDAVQITRGPSHTLAPVGGMRALSQIGTLTRDDDSTPLEALECSLLAFEANDDVLALVPMPPTIHAALRGALTDVFAREFSYYEDLHEWLHRSNEMLGGKSPFEVLIAGDGRAVLRAALRQSSATRQRRSKNTSSQLRIVR